MKTQKHKQRFLKLPNTMPKLDIPKPEHKMGYTFRECKTFMSPKEYQEFEYWTNGQTCCSNDKDELVIYSWDVERFLELQRHKKPTYWD